jgi:hypothetical protein
MVDAVELVRQRLLRATAALKGAGIPHAVVGGNAVAAWVSTIDKAAARNTQDVDIMIRRSDFDATKKCLENAGFIHRHVSGLDLFLDDASSTPRNAVHLIFAGELVRQGEPAHNPDVVDAVDFDTLRVLDLKSLVQIKLTAFRRKDQVHLMDLIGVGLIDQSWTSQFPPILASRLQQLLDTPDG